MYETRTSHRNGRETITVLIGKHVIARITEHPHPRLPRPQKFVAEGVTFEGSSPAYRTPTPAILWAIKEHQNGRR